MNIYCLSSALVIKSNEWTWKKKSTFDVHFRIIIRLLRLMHSLETTHIYWYFIRHRPQPIFNYNMHFYSRPSHNSNVFFLFQIYFHAFAMLFVFDPFQFRVYSSRSKFIFFFLLNHSELYSHSAKIIDSSQTYKLKQQQQQKNTFCCDINRNIAISFCLFIINQKYQNFFINSVNIQIFVFVWKTKQTYK